MTAILSTNNLATRDSKAPAPELREDGTNYPYRMFFNGGEDIVDADSVEECIECLISGYSQLGDQAQFDARINFCLGIQQQLRVNILANVNPNDLKDWEFPIIAGEYGDEHSIQDPYGWGDGEGKLNGEIDEDNIDFWSSKTPLVLIDVNYQPFNNVPKPLSSEGDYEFVSNIIWLKPSDELLFLRSLSYANVIRFGAPRETNLA